MKKGEQDTQDDAVEGLTSMPVGIHCIGSCYGNVVQQAKAMAANWVIGTGHNPCGPCMMPRGPYGTEGISHLHPCTFPFISTNRPLAAQTNR